MKNEELEWNQVISYRRKLHGVIRYSIAKTYSAASLGGHGDIGLSYCANVEFISRPATRPLANLSMVDDIDPHTLISQRTVRQL